MVNALTTTSIQQNLSSTTILFPPPINGQPEYTGSQNQPDRVKPEQCQRKKGRHRKDGRFVISYSLYRHFVNDREEKTEHRGPHPLCDRMYQSIVFGFYEENCEHDGKNSPGECLPHSCGQGTFYFFQLVPDADPGIYNRRSRRHLSYSHRFKKFILCEPLAFFD